MESVRLGGLYDGATKHQAGAVWDKNQLSPTIDTMQGGNREPMIIEEPKIMYEEPLDRPGWHRLAKEVLNVNGICTAIPAQSNNLVKKIKVEDCQVDTVRIKNNNAKGYEECVVGGVADFLYPSSTTRRGRVQENGNVSPTLTSENSGVCRIEKVGQISSDGSQYGTVISENGLSSTLAAGTHGYANNCIQQQYRIRKLTPLECWRLMGFSDEDFHKAEQVNSNTQLYKQAGNSIVVDVLETIFKNLL